MTIETKFNLGDTVWYMDENRAVSAVVMSVHVTVNGKALLGGGQSYIDYALNVSGGLRRHESKLFPDKPSLLASL